MRSSHTHYIRLAVAALSLGAVLAGPGGAPARGGGGGGSRDPASSVPPETLAFLRRTVLSVNEACRHFWRALPASTPARREKVRAGWCWSVYDSAPVALLTVLYDSLRRVAV